ncbi:hypothetical protein ACMAUO_04470 [Gluconacetobacter sp. Hr-1-5]|uniref:hypothetical protein n=1 Tax=Gluconacetobacter sp. Hr-1-5 TaxID=3395370 RepID=UPI003B52890B
MDFPTVPNADQTLLPNISTTETRQPSARIGYSLAIKMALVDFALNVLCLLALPGQSSADPHNHEQPGYIALFVDFLFTGPLMETSIFHFGYKFIFSRPWNLTGRTRLIFYIILSDLIFFVLHLPKQSHGIFTEHSFSAALVIGFVSGSIFSLTYYQSIRQHCRPYLTTALCHGLCNGLLEILYFL